MKHYIMRHFLSNDADSYVRLESWVYENGYELKIADCVRSIVLSFSALPNNKRASLAKLKKLKKAVDYLYEVLGGEESE